MMEKWKERCKEKFKLLFDKRMNARMMMEELYGI
jgi:hypothetical protein